MYECVCVVLYWFTHMQGSLRAAIDSGMLDDRLTRRPNYLTTLTLALVRVWLLCVKRQRER